MKTSKYVNVTINLPHTWKAYRGMWGVCACTGRWRPALETTWEQGRNSSWKLQ